MLAEPARNEMAENHRKYDDEQLRLMEEQCIVVNQRDEAVFPPESKKTCHRMENINRGLLHRAFSVFLFNEQGELLLQQRSDEKITFPGYWTNTCCSHPLAVAGETDEAGQLGVRRAARRKLKHELGIELPEAALADFQFLTRILYMAPSDCGEWGEHEIDYILFLRAPVTLDVNANEVKAVRYVSPDALRALFADPSVKLTPWFKLIVEHFIFPWWAQLGALEKCKQVDVIHNLLPAGFSGGISAVGSTGG